MRAQHIFDPELENAWVSSIENALDGLLRVGVWECETEITASVGWSYNHLDTFKSRINCRTWDVGAIQEFDLMFNTFDGVKIQQSLSDRSNSSFYDPISANSISNARIVSSNHLKAFMADLEVSYSYRPDLALKSTSPSRWWTLYRKFATYTIKYAFGGTRHSGWWTPPNHSWDTYPLGVPQFDSIKNLGVDFILDGPPYVQRTEFSVQWFKYRYTFDWPLKLDSGCRLDNWEMKWFQFYSVTTGYGKFSTIENLTKYDPVLGSASPTTEFCFRYNIQDNIDFFDLSAPEVGGAVVVLTGRLDSRSEYKSIDAEMLVTSESEFVVTFGPRLSLSIETIAKDEGWGASWGLQNYGE